MQRAGADGILSVTPYYNKPTREGLFQHYKAIAEAVPLPIVIYNVPGRTGVNVDPQTLTQDRGPLERGGRQGSVGQHDADV